MSKNILICTETLGIGGVESVVFSQALALKKKGFNVYVLAGNGENKSKIEKEKIEIIDCEYKVTNTFDTEEVEKVVSIIKEKKIDEIQVHKIICIPLMLMVCEKVDIPYVYYAHDELSETYDWFVNNFNIYSLSIKVFLENAYKIVCISESAKNHIEQKFNIVDSRKYIIKRNCVNFDIYTTEKELDVEKVRKFLIVSRIAHEKLISVKNAIDVFIKYTDETGLDTKLTIIGDGDKKDEIINIVNDFKSRYNIEYKGAVDNVTEKINENEVIIGLNRCILEAMAIKRIVVLSGYKNLKGIISEENIELALEDNLSGNNLKSLTVEEQVKQLMNLSKNEIEKITKSNFEKLKKENDINNNIFTIPNNEEKTKRDYSMIYSEINKLSKKIINLEEQKKKIWEERVFFSNQNESKEKRILNLEDEIKRLSDKNEKITNELNSIKERRIYKIVNKISQIRKK